MRYRLCLGLVLAGFAVAGCAPAVVATGATAVVVAHDRRTTGAFVDDELIEVKAGSALSDDPDIKNQTHINVTSVNGVVLLTGEAPTTELRDRVLSKVRDVPGVRRTVNEIRIAEPSSIAGRSDDTWITTKVKTQLLRVKELDSSQVKVVTEHDVVYLMGLVYRREADAATDVARGIGGVERVVKLFEYLD